jgi:hypothetical protein
MRGTARRITLSAAALAILALVHSVDPVRALDACGLGCSSTCLEQGQGRDLCQNVCGVHQYTCITENPPCPPEPGRAQLR